MTTRAERFAAAARSAAATVDPVGAPGAVRQAVADYLEREGLQPRVRVSAGALAYLGDGPPEIVTAPPRPDGDTVVTGCAAALAEEGAVVLVSSAAHRAESAFIAETHIVIVEASQLLGSMDELWPRLRAIGPMPRAINVIRGPSRTADLGVPSRLGAHGPLRVHVILVGGIE